MILGERRDVGSEGMRREQRLRRAAEFSAVYHRGRSWSNNFLAVKVLPNRRPGDRTGFAVGKKLGGAVVRNRVKRRLREIIRRLPLSGGHDVVVIARAPAVAAEFGVLRAAVVEVFRRAKLMSPDSSTAATRHAGP